MDTLQAFSIPIKGLQDGIHWFEFQIEKNFFDAFENSMITEGRFDVKLQFDKRPDMFVLEFDFTGTVKTTCDRCLEIMDLPISNTETLLVKFAEEPKEEEEIVYITSHLTAFNVAKYIYEYINLSLPLIKTHDLTDDESVCNEDMLKHLDSESDQGDTPSNPIWEELKKLNNKN